jgi:glycosyltransferase involved in cell wall biosynthesis
MAEVSVVIPCFNAEKYIFFAVESILNQSFTDLEVIVVDDNSSDKSLKILKTIVDKRLKIIELKQNSGYPTAMKIGIENASGIYIARMDADDISVKNRIWDQIQLIKKNPSCAFVATNRFRMTPNGKKYNSKEIFETKTIVQTWNNLVFGPRIFADASVLFSKEKYNNVGGYRTYQRSGMDVDLWLRLLEKYDPALAFTDSYYGHRLLPGSIVFQPKTQKINQIPRLLAKKRIENRNNTNFVEESLMHSNLISEIELSNPTKNQGLKSNIGMAVNCFIFRDWKGGFSFISSIVCQKPLKIGFIIKEFFIIFFKRFKQKPFLEVKLDNL